LGAGLLAGAGVCDGSASLGIPLPADPLLFGASVTVQSAFLCPAGGFGLSQGIEFPIGR
jgi:hypothetical protein